MIISTLTGAALAVLVSTGVVAADSGGLSGTSQGLGSIADTGKRAGNTDPALAYYFVLIQDKITGNWTPPMIEKGKSASLTVSFTILRSGQVQNLAIDSSSGDRHLEESALRAVRVSVPLPPLPPQFKPGTLDLQLQFSFGREQGRVDFGVTQGVIESGRERGMSPPSSVTDKPARKPFERRVKEACDQEKNRSPSPSVFKDPLLFEDEEGRLILAICAFERGLKGKRFWFEEDYASLAHSLFNDAPASRRSLREDTSVRSFVAQELVEGEETIYSHMREALRGAKKSAAESQKTMFMDTALWVKVLLDSGDRAFIKLDDFMNTYSGTKDDVLSLYFSPVDPIERKRAELRKGKKDREEQERLRLQQIDAKPWPAEVKALAKARRIRIAMNKNQVIASWGKPNTVKRIVSEDGIQEYWFYHWANSTVRFDDDKVTSWQTTE